MASREWYEIWYHCQLNPRGSRRAGEPYATATRRRPYPDSMWSAFLLPAATIDGQSLTPIQAPNPLSCANVSTGVFGLPGS
jgi:hypothetical protein